jgi:hypothetical protein
MFWYGNAFWLFIVVIALAGIVSGIIRRAQREKTIRLAIEKGVTLDPATLENLRPSRPQDARAGLMTGAIVTFFVGTGLGVMGYVLSIDGDVSTFRSLAAVGGLMWCIAAGLFVARLAIRPKT